MNTDSKDKINKFQNYHVAYAGAGESMELRRRGFRRLLALDAQCRGLVWLDVYGDPWKGGESEMRELREKVARFQEVESEVLLRVREIGVDDGLVYVVRDVSAGEVIASYVARQGGRMRVGDALGLARQFADVLVALGTKVEMGFNGHREALVEQGEDGYLRLLLEIPVSIGSEIVRLPGQGSSAHSQVHSVCDFLHFCLCGSWMGVAGDGQFRPSLGDLPDEVRFLFWSVCQGTVGRSANPLGRLIDGLAEIEGRFARQPARGDLVPRSEIGRLLFGDLDIGRLQGGKYERAFEGEARERDGGIHGETVLQQPFGYAMTLRALPSAGTFGESPYSRHLSGIETGRAGGDRAALRVFGQVTPASVHCVVEEKVNGKSLQEIARARGGFDAGEALTLLSKIDKALTRLEGRGLAPWWLNAANCLVHCEGRIEDDGVFRANVALWPSHEIVLRLHPTMADLLSGRDEGAREDGEGNPVGARLFAALFCQLVAFRPQRQVPGNGEFRPLRRLHDQGNAFLRSLFSEAPACPASKDRATFLARLRSLESSGALGFGVKISSKGFVTNDKGCSSTESQYPERPLPASRTKGDRQSGRPVSKRRIRWRAAVVAGTVCLLGGGVLLWRPEAPRGALGGGDRLLAESSETQGARTIRLPGAGASERDSGNLDDLVPVRFTEKPLPGVPFEDARDLPPCVTDPLPEDRESDLPPSETPILEELLGALRAGGVPPWDEAGLAALRRAAGAGSLNALLCLGDSYSAAGDARAIDYYRESALSGLPAGMRVYAEHLLGGKGIAPDADEALLWFRKAADAGDRHALEWLGELRQSPSQATSRPVLRGSAGSEQ